MVWWFNSFFSNLQLSMGFHRYHWLGTHSQVVLFIAQSEKELKFNDQADRKIMQETLAADFDH